MTLWLILIILHALCAVVAVGVSGWIIFTTTFHTQLALSRLLIISLLGVELFMIGATISHWTMLSAGERIAFSLLPLLGLYMIFRAVRARSRIILNSRHEKVINDSGFIFIALLNGFVIVGLLDVSLPVWAVVIGAVITTILGNRIVALAHRKFAKEKNGRGVAAL